MLVYRRVPCQKPAEFDRFLYLCGLSISGFRVKSIRLPVHLVGGWAYPSEKWWSSSVGMMKFPIYGKIKFMFQTTNQMYICGSKCRAPTLQCQALKTQQISTLVLVWMNNVHNQDATPSECSSTWIQSFTPRKRLARLAIGCAIEGVLDWNSYIWANNRGMQSPCPLPFLMGS